MAIQRIPIFGDATAFNYTIAIDGINYLLEFIYMARQEAWYLSIFQPDRTPLRTGIRVVDFWPLNGRDLDPRLFDGVIQVIRTDGKTGIDPSLEDFQQGAVTVLLITGADLDLGIESAEESLLIEAVP